MASKRVVTGSASMPKSKEFASLGVDLSDLLYRPLPQRKLVGSMNALAPLATNPEDDDANRRFVATDIEERKEELMHLCEASAAWRWLSTREPFRSMQASLARFARRPDSRFSGSYSPYFLVVAVAMSMYQYTRHIESATSPQAIKRKDWTNAIRAVGVLRGLSGAGVNLSNAFTPRSSVPFDWLRQLETSLVSARASAKKPSSDERATDRSAAKAFTRWLLLYFDAAPTTMVENFGRLIDYDSDALRKHVSRWVEDYRIGSLV